MLKRKRMRESRIEEGEEEEGANRIVMEEKTEEKEGK